MRLSSFGRRSSVAGAALVAITAVIAWGRPWGTGVRDVARNPDSSLPSRSKEATKDSVASTPGHESGVPSTIASTTHGSSRNGQEFPGRAVTAVRETIDAPFTGTGPVASREPPARVGTPQEEGIPSPPPEYRGTPLMWRLKYPMEPARFEALLRDLRHLSVPERIAVLQKVKSAKDPAHGKILLEEIPRLPESPITLYDVASALAETAQGAKAIPEGQLRSGGLPTARDLAAAALGLLARKTQDYGSVMNEQEWTGVNDKLERLQEIDPELLAGSAAEESLATIRRGVEIALRKTLGGEEGYLGGEACFRLARRIADEGTHGVVVELLQHWEQVQRTFPSGQSRPDRVALHHAARTLLVPPCPTHGRVAIETLVSQFRAERTVDPNTRMEELLRGLGHSQALPEEWRRTLLDALK